MAKTAAATKPEPKKGSLVRRYQIVSLAGRNTPERVIDTKDTREEAERYLDEKRLDVMGDVAFTVREVWTYPPRGT
jgi:hypothetical protein